MRDEEGRLGLSLTPSVLWRGTPVRKEVPVGRPVLPPDALSVGLRASARGAVHRVAILVAWLSLVQRQVIAPGTNTVFRSAAGPR